MPGHSAKTRRERGEKRRKRNNAKWCKKSYERRRNGRCGSKSAGKNRSSQQGSKKAKSVKSTLVEPLKKKTVEPDPSLDQTKSSRPLKKSKTVPRPSTPEKLERKFVPLHTPKKPRRNVLPDPNNSRGDVRRSIDFSQEHFGQGSDAEDRLLGADNSPVPRQIARPPSSHKTTKAQDCPHCLCQSAQECSEPREDAGIGDDNSVHTEGVQPDDDDGIGLESDGTNSGGGTSDNNSDSNHESSGADSDDDVGMGAEGGGTELEDDTSVDNGDMDDGSSDDTSNPHCVLHDNHPDTCANCCRKCIHNRTDLDLGNASHDYSMYLKSIGSDELHNVQSPLRRVKVHRVGNNNVTRYNLCEQCTAFLKKCEPGLTPKEQAAFNKARFDWKNVWPSFYWNLLTGSCSRSGKKFHEVYSAREIWKYIPPTIREYWTGAILRNEYNKAVRYDGEVDTIYNDCTKIKDRCLTHN